MWVELHILQNDHPVMVNFDQVIHFSSIIDNRVGSHIVTTMWNHDFSEPYSFQVRENASEIRAMINGQKTT